MRDEARTRINVAAALLCGLALRMWFVRAHPWVTGDVLIYGAIAKNWLQAGVYGFAVVAGSVLPTLIRLPGYPLFVAACFRVFGMEHYGAVMYVQVLLDLVTCGMIGALTARLAGRRAGLAALWLAALCPFTANYAAAPLTETLSLFCITVAFYAMERWCAAGMGWNRWLWVSAAGMAYAVLVRPDQGLLPAAILPAMAWMGCRRSGVRAAGPVLVAAMCVVLPLAPWTARNWRTFHVFEPLAPRYATDPGESIPLGFQRWFKTWATDYRSTEEVYWQYDGQPINLGDVPARAFDSAEEYARTKAAMDAYDNALSDSPELEAQFQALADERTHAHPLRTYVTMPLARTADMWVRPRTEMLPIALEWWDFKGSVGKSTFALGYMLLDVGYLALAAAGIWIWRRRGWSGERALAGAMLAFVVLRSGLLLTIDNSEPRYVLEFWPMVLMLGGMAVGWFRSAAD